MKVRLFFLMLSIAALPSAQADPPDVPETQALTIQERCLSTRLKNIRQELRTIGLADLRDLPKLTDRAIQDARVIKAPTDFVIPGANELTLKVTSYDKLLDLAKDSETAPYIRVKSKSSRMFEGRLESRDPPRLVVQGRGGKYYDVALRPKEIGSVEYFRQEHVGRDWEKIEPYQIGPDRAFKSVRSRPPTLEAPPAHLTGDPYRNAPIPETASHSSHSNGPIVSLDIEEDRPLTGVWVSQDPPIFRISLQNGEHRWLEINPKRLRGSAPGRVPTIKGLHLKEGDPILIASSHSYPEEKMAAIEAQFVRFDERGNLIARQGTRILQVPADKISSGKKVVARNDSDLEEMLEFFGADRSQAEYGSDSIYEKVFLERGEEQASREYPYSGGNGEPRFSLELTRHGRAPSGEGISFTGLWRQYRYSDLPGSPFRIDGIKMDAKDALRLAQVIMESVPPKSWRGGFQLSFRGGKANLSFYVWNGQTYYSVRDLMYSKLPELEERFPELKAANRWPGRKF